MAVAVVDRLSIVSFARFSVVEMVLVVVVDVSETVIELLEVSKVVDVSSVIILSVVVVVLNGLLLVDTGVKLGTVVLVADEEVCVVEVK